MQVQIYQYDTWNDLTDSSKSIILGNSGKSSGINIMKAKYICFNSKIYTGILVYYIIKDFYINLKLLPKALEGDTFSLNDGSPF